MTSRPPLLFYAHHGLGLGHLVRTWTLIRELRQQFTVVLVSGGEAPEGLTAPRGIELVQLPALTMEIGGSLRAARGTASVEHAKHLRRELVLETYRACRPAVVVVELFPFGRKQLAGEIVPMLSAARAEPHEARPRVFCSVRDILVSRGVDQASHDERARRWAEQYFDGILVHADPRVVRFEDTFRPAPGLTVPVHYTGFVVRDGHHRLPANAARNREVLVSAGGGRVAAPLLGAALDAHRHLWDDLGLSMRIVAGPFVPEALWGELRQAASTRAGLHVDRVVPALGPMLRTCAVSVSQCGYNTALEVVRSGVPAVVVPFSEAGEDEQGHRARRLEARGLVRVLDAAELSGPALAAAVQHALDSRPPRAALRMRGAAVTLRVLRSQLRTHDWRRRARCAGVATS